MKPQEGRGEADLESQPTSDAALASGPSGSLAPSKRSKKRLLHSTTQRLHTGLEVPTETPNEEDEGRIPGRKYKIPYMPILESKKKAGWTRDDFQPDALLDALMPPPAFIHDHTGKAYFYDHERLLSPKALFILTGTAFVQGEVLNTLVYMLCLAGTIAASFALFVPSVRRFDTQGFSYFVTFMKVFISFMLSVFLKMAFSRWWYSMSKFKMLLITIKQYMWLLRCASLNDALFNLIQRYSVASCYILTCECYCSQHITLGDGLERRQKTYDWLVEEGFLTPSERNEINNVAHLTDYKLGVATATIWMWIGELTSHMSRPSSSGAPMSGPMYVRMLMLTQACVKTIEDLKTNLAVQIPVGYAHLLSFLVHLNNTIIAISCGLAFGSAAGEVISRRRQMEEEQMSASVHKELLGEMYGAAQVMGVQLLILCIEPVLYQSFSHIAHMLMYPFGDEAYHLPMESYIHELHVDLAIMAKARCEWTEHHQDLKAKDLKRKDDGRNDDAEEGDEGGDDDGGGDGDG